MPISTMTGISRDEIESHRAEEQSAFTLVTKLTKADLCEMKYKPWERIVEMLQRISKGETNKPAADVTIPFLWTGPGVQPPPMGSMTGMYSGNLPAVNHWGNLPAVNAWNPTGADTFDEFEPNGNFASEDASDPPEHGHHQGHQGHVQPSQPTSQRTTQPTHQRNSDAHTGNPVLWRNDREFYLLCRQAFGLTRAEEQILQHLTNS